MVWKNNLVSYNNNKKITAMKTVMKNALILNIPVWLYIIFIQVFNVDLSNVFI